MCKAIFSLGVVCLGLASAPVWPQSSKPGVTIYATGGTIAGAASSKINTTTYTSASMSLQSLLDALPELASVATVTGEQFSNVDSNEITTDLLLKLARKINRQLDKSQIHGVVVTHGTDTLEETAFFLDLTTASSGKPVVVVGAMRPATSLSADGPFNLFQAVNLAASNSAENRGALVVMNDRISSGFYVAKTNATSVDTFRSLEAGYLGAFVGVTPKFYYTAATPSGKPAFDVSNLESLPKVSIVYMHQDQSSEQIDAALGAGSKGIVLAGTGNGSMPPAVRQRIQELSDAGFPIVRTTRTGSGFVTKRSEGIAGGALNAQKARILLMLALGTGADMDLIRHYFNQD